jgi:hypothetical protein
LNVVSVSKKMERDLDEEAESQIGFQKVLWENYEIVIFEESENRLNIREFVPI